MVVIGNPPLSALRSQCRCLHRFQQAVGTLSTLTILPTAIHSKLHDARTFCVSAFRFGWLRLQPAPHWMTSFNEVGRLSYSPPLPRAIFATHTECQPGVFAHIRTCHADVPRSFFHQFQPQVTIISTAKHYNLTSGRWQCGWCDERVPCLPTANGKHQPENAFEPAQKHQPE